MTTSVRVGSAVQNVMRGNKGRDTAPEVRVRAQLHRAGFRFRKHYRIKLRTVQTTPDVAFTRRRLAVYIDGCFWHGCPEPGRRPRSDTHFWDEKFERNKRRDRRAVAALRAEGWTVLRFSEHEDSTIVVEAVARELRRLP